MSLTQEQCRDLRLSQHLFGLSKTSFGDREQYLRILLEAEMEVKNKKRPII